MSDEQPSAQQQYEGAIRQRRTSRGTSKAPQTTTLPSPGMPMAVARLFIEERCQCDGVPTLPSLARNVVAVASLALARTGE